MTEDMSQIIAGIRSSYDRTNMQDVDLEEMLSSRPEVKVGYLLQHMEPESQREYAVNFDPVQSLFLDKLVSEEVLRHRVNMDKDDFFRGIVFLDYLTTIVLNDYRVLDDLDEIATELERRDKDLDPDLSLVVAYSGMYYISHAGRMLVRERDDRRSQERYRQKNKKYEPEYVILRRISPVYEALGAMVCDLAHNDVIKRKLPDMLYLYDIKAAIFVDAIIDNLEDADLKLKILDKFQRGEYYKASMLAITGISREVSNNTITDYIDAMTEANGDAGRLNARRGAG